MSLLGSLLSGPFPFLVLASAAAISAGLVCLRARVTDSHRSWDGPPPHVLALCCGLFLLLAAALLPPLAATPFGRIGRSQLYLILLAAAVLLLRYSSHWRSATVWSAFSHEFAIAYSLSLWWAVLFVRSVVDPSDSRLTIIITLAALGFSHIHRVIRRTYTDAAFGSGDRLTPATILGLAAFSVGCAIPYIYLLLLVMRVNRLLQHSGSPFRSSWLYACLCLAVSIAGLPSLKSWLPRLTRGILQRSRHALSTCGLSIAAVALGRAIGPHIRVHSWGLVRDGNASGLALPWWYVEMHLTGAVLVATFAAVSVMNTTAVLQHKKLGAWGRLVLSLIWADIALFWIFWVIVVAPWSHPTLLAQAAGIGCLVYSCAVLGSQGLSTDRARLSYLTSEDPRVIVIQDLGHSFGLGILCVGVASVIYVNVTRDATSSFVLLPLLFAITKPFLELVYFTFGNNLRHVETQREALIAWDDDLPRGRRHRPPMSWADTLKAAVVRQNTIATLTLYVTGLGVMYWVERYLGTLVADVDDRHR